MRNRSVALFALITAVFFTVNSMIDRAGSSRAESAAGPVQIVNRGSRSLTLTFTPKGYSAYSQQVNGEELSSISFSGATYMDEPGKPQIPYYTAILGIPSGARIQFEILETDFELVSETKLLPHPSPRKVNGWLEPEFVPETATYNSAEAFPSQLVTLQEPAFFREQQIARVRVAGIQFLPARNQVKKYNRIVLKVNFIGGQLQSERRTLPSAMGEHFYKKAILNYEQAKNWRLSGTPKTALNKQADIFNSTLYRFTITDEGMYKIDGRLLESNNINLDDIDPARIRLFNNGGRELPRDINAVRPEGLVENAIKVVDGGDGRFDRDDYILFYGTGVEGWQYDPVSKEFEHYINHYEVDNFYWLNLDGSTQGLRMASVNSASPSGNVTNDYLGMAFLEEELDNPLNSGLNWFGRQFRNDDPNETFNLDLANAITSDSLRLKIRFAPKSSGDHRLQVSINGNLLGQRVTRGESFGQYLRMRIVDLAPFEAANVLLPGVNTLELSYSHVSDFAEAMLDWFELFYSARLSAIDNQLAFTVLPAPGWQTFRISNLSDDATGLFDITDFANVKEIIGANFSNNSLTFTDLQETALPKRFFVSAISRYKEVEALERMEMTDLRNSGFAPEYIIITHDDFFNEALRLESLRENGNPDNRLNTQVVRISDIYDNFSGGLLDPVAIRDFLKFAFENWRQPPSFEPPGYVLLFGDGDYDYKNRISSADKNWIPPFQTDELETTIRLEELVSRTTDSWFTYVSGNDPIMDMAIGRINVRTATDAANVIDKIIDYETRPVRGKWRNTITVVGDDELVTGGRPSAVDNIHLAQAEAIIDLSIPKKFDLKKIYLTEFPKVLTSSNSGVTKPAAQDALIKQINEGTLIVNFIGHGNPTVWAHEVVFQQSDNSRVQNIDKPVFFIAATCDWALFDDPTRESMAEDMIIAQRRGAIAILSAARLVFSRPNANFNEIFYEQLFGPGPDVARIGDAFMLTRTLTGTSSSVLVNDEKYHIYGDPTLKIAAPKREAVITSMVPDSVVALSTVELSGDILDENGQPFNFNGKALVNTFDSEKFVQYVPEAGFANPYFLPGNSIYRGIVPVNDGRFTARFIVPKDISYGGKRARVSVYFWNDEIDGAGFRNNILVSSSTSTITDLRGPEIKLFFKEHENFTTGDVIDENVVLVAEMADTLSGINIAGEIGHRITLSIDPDDETCLAQLNRFRGTSSVNLTDFFSFDEGNHLQGRTEFPLNFPSEVDIGGSVVRCTDFDGNQRHRLVVKAWDNSNNSSTASIEVLVVHEEGLVIQELMNYPNPFTDKTTFTFNSSREAEVRIKIFTVSGQLIRTLERPFIDRGFNMIEWDGRDESGDVPANGVYLYKFIARSQDNAAGDQKEIIGKLAIVR